MVKIEHDTLIIRLSHPCPKEALTGLQIGIIATLKFQYSNYDKIMGLEPSLMNSNHLLLELLESTLKQEE